MKDVFQAYYRAENDDLRKHFGECVFSFDTNVLLNLYRFTSVARKSVIETLGIIRDRVWIPHQVGLEFHRNRPGELMRQFNQGKELRKIVTDATKKLGELRRSSLFAVTKLVDDVAEKLQQIADDIQLHDLNDLDLLSPDETSDDLARLFENRIGQSYGQQDLDSIYKTAKHRYGANVPPGYKDRNNDQNNTEQYGDYVIWRQLLDFATKDGRPITFVTDDAKEDWWWEIAGKTLGPRPELIDEFNSAVNGKSRFHMYSTESFLRYAKAYLNATLSGATIAEAERIETIEREKSHRRNVVELKNPWWNEPTITSRDRNTDIGKLIDLLTAYNRIRDSLGKKLITVRDLTESEWMPQTGKTMVNNFLNDHCRFEPLSTTLNRSLNEFVNWTLENYGSEDAK